ncbi:MAG: 50S ribosomal protein L5, partial [Sweet potato little leaf phytoplasma]|nr:50S ribosomal protein L5 [Sweet potato little leaf phytoplasma]
MPQKLLVKKVTKNTTLISGQTPINTEAKKSISNFKLRTKEI